jgi:phosphoglycerate dehydrogenase-like enzyme
MRTARTAAGTTASETPTGSAPTHPMRDLARAAALTDPAPDAPIVWVSEPIAASAVAELSDFLVVPGYGPTAVPYARIAPIVAAVMLRSRAFPAAEVAAGTSLRIIARHGVGFDAVDIGAAAARGIPVTNTPGGNAVAVAELTLALILAVYRRLPIAAHATDRTPDGFEALRGHNVQGKALTLVGAGSIAKAVAVRALACGMRVRLAIIDSEDVDRVERIRRTAAELTEVAAALGSAETPSDSAAAPTIETVEAIDLDTALADTDVLSLHIPLSDRTRHLIDTAALARLPDRAIVVNNARGGIVDDTALASAIAAGELAGAGLDCTEVEPVPTDHPLRKLPGVIVTPHIGALTAETADIVGCQAARQIAAVLHGGRPQHVVNAHLLPAAD